MYSNANLHRLVEGALDSWLPGEGQVFSLTLTPKQRECLLKVLSQPDAVVTGQADAIKAE